MSLLPKTKYSGFIIIIILFLVLAMGFLVVFTRHQNEIQLINRAFIKLRQNSQIITSKIREYSRMCESVGYVNANPNKAWAMKGYVINIGPDNSAWVSSNSTEDRNSFTTKKFFSDIIDRSVFDDYCVFTANELFFKTFQVEAKSDKDYLAMLTDNLYMPDNYHIFSRKKDSVLMRSSLRTGFISRIYINYTKYYQFVYPMRVNDQIWYISGLISDTNYSAKKQHVESWVLILIGILLLFTFFSFQFFKLLLLTKTERIKTQDTVLICLSISGLACIVPLLIINIFTVTGIGMKTDRQLIELNNSIKSGFINEMKLMYNATLAYEKINKDSTPVTHILSANHSLIDSNTIKNYPYFKGLFCVIKNGNSEKIISTWEEKASSPVAYRQYVRKSGEWGFPFAGEDCRFRLESIYSNTSGDVMAVLSRPSDTRADSLYCISSVMYSLINTVLPPGFEFRIIGKDGQVWFHSDPKKNNRENFLYECENNSEITEAIHNRVSANVALQISSKNYRAYISPIGTIPLYLVTLSDTREQNEFLSHVNYMIVIFILIGIFCGLVSTGIFYYEQLGIEFSGRMPNDVEPGLIWLLPDVRKNERYMVIFGLNLLLGVLMIIPVFSRRTTELHFLFILISLYSLFFMYCYCLLKTFKKKIFKWSIVFTFSVILVCCNILYGNYLPKQFLFIVLEIIAIVVVLIVLYRTLNLRHYAQEDFRETDFPDLPERHFGFPGQPHMPYVLFVYSWIMIAAILPTIILFKISGREEVELITRKNQLEIAAKIDRKNFQIDSLYIAHIYTNEENNNPVIATKLTRKLDRIKENLKLKGNYFLNQYSQIGIGDYIPLKFQSNKPDNIYIILSRKLRQMFGAEDIRSYEMLYGIGSDTTWFWNGGYLNPALHDSLLFYYTATKKSADSSFSAYQIKLSSNLIDQKTNPRSFGTRFLLFELLVIFMFMVLLFFLIRRLIIKLFILEKPFIPNLIQIKEVLEAKSRVFIVNALHQEKIKELVNGTFSILESDDAGKWVPTENNLIIINTLPGNLKRWMQLFKGINNLLKQKSGQIIVLSNYSPRQIIEMADERIQSIANEKIRNSLLIVKQNYLKLLSEFAVYYYEVDSIPVKLPKGLNNSKTSKEINQTNEITVFLKKELKFIGYSGGMDKRLEGIIFKEEEIERLKPKLYNLFATKYQLIWERCTLNEKFILLDLAMDSVVNTRNIEDINSLIGKGILEVNGRLDFVSRGFKHFVLDLSGTEIFQALQKDTKRTDGWNKIKVPIYIIFGAVVIFFFLTMQEVVSGMVTTILSLGGFFTALWKLGLFGKSAQSDK